MKKIKITLLVVFSFVFLTACTTDIYIEPDTVAIVFENVRFEGENLVIDIYLTNGYDVNQYVEYMGFDIYSSDEEMYIAGGGFDILEDVPANGYVFFTIEFGSDYIFKTETEIIDAGYSLEDIALYYYQE